MPFPYHLHLSVSSSIQDEQVVIQDATVVGWSNSSYISSWWGTVTGPSLSELVSIRERQRGMSAVAGWWSRFFFSEDCNSSPKFRFSSVHQNLGNFIDAVNIRVWVEMSSPSLRKNMGKENPVVVLSPGSSDAHMREKKDGRERADIIGWHVGLTHIISHLVADSACMPTQMHSIKICLHYCFWDKICPVLKLRCKFRILGET